MTIELQNLLPWDYRPMGFFYFTHSTAKNQSVENAGVAFVKGANERNEFFVKYKQTVMYDEEVQTNKAKDYQCQGRTDMGG